MNSNEKELEQQENGNNEILNEYDENINLLNKWKGLDEGSKFNVIEWILEQYLDETEIKKNAINYFWFLDKEWVWRFDTTINSDLNSEAKNFLDYGFDWEGWNDESLGVLSKRLEKHLENWLAKGLQAELKSSIEEAI
jgi:hypothetical protein